MPALPADQPFLDLAQHPIAGWEGLRIDCDACRTIYMVTWPMIRRRSGQFGLVNGAGPKKVELYRIEHHGRGSPSTETMGTGNV